MQHILLREIFLAVVRMIYHLWKCKDKYIGSAVDFKSHFRVDKSNIACLLVPKNFYWVSAVKGELMIPNQWREVIFKVVFDPPPPSIYHDMEGVGDGSTILFTNYIYMDR